ncbi:MAG: hypothetical protein PHI73_04470 [Patescibacteria group bacterium]|nr:hypothetical protein [Patescibacteria group bacterium]
MRRVVILLVLFAALCVVVMVAPHVIPQLTIQKSGFVDSWEVGPMSDPKFILFINIPESSGTQHRCFTMKPPPFEVRTGAPQIRYGTMIECRIHPITKRVIGATFSPDDYEIRPPTNGI